MIQWVDDDTICILGNEQEHSIMRVSIYRTVLDIKDVSWRSLMTCGHYCNNQGRCYQVHSFTCCNCSRICNTTCEICRLRYR